MARAYNNALLSPDPSSQNGAVLCQIERGGAVRVLSGGYNHFYPGIPPELHDRDVKLQRIEHAERDAIYRALVTRGTIMFCPWAACHDCARAIIGSGLRALFYHRERYELTDERWIGQVKESLNWMRDSGVDVIEFSGTVPSVYPILVSGKLWDPSTCEYVE